MKSINKHQVSTTSRWGRRRKKKPIWSLGQLQRSKQKLQRRNTKNHQSVILHSYYRTWKVISCSNYSNIRNYRIKCSTNGWAWRGFYWVYWQWGWWYGVLLHLLGSQFWKFLVCIQQSHNKCAAQESQARSIWHRQCIGHRKNCISNRLLSALFPGHSISSNSALEL